MRGGGTHRRNRVNGMGVTSDSKGFGASGKDTREESGDDK